MLTLAIPALAQSVDEQYSNAIRSADEYFTKADYLNAKASYQIATQLKPDEQYPKDRLRLSIDRLRVQMEEMAVYNDKLATADRLYKEGALDRAIAAYQEALKMMPSQDYPSRQIELIRKEQADMAEQESLYATFMNEGNRLFGNQQYKEARKKYEEASAVFPDRQEASDKVKEVDRVMAEIASQQSGYEKAISQAEMYHARKDYENELAAYQRAMELKPEEPLPQVKIRELNEFLKKYEAYNNYVSQADEFYIGQQFAEARVLYEKALEVLPDESYPKEIISKINIALAEQSEKNKAAYEEAIAKADELYNAENYDAAMLAYSEALRFWPDGDYARQRISSIAEIRALQKAQEEAYNNAISLADKLFADKDYMGARDEYRKATEIKPFEQYPKVRLNEIDMVLAEIQDKIDQYEQIIQGADKLFNVGDYEQARIQYLRAQDILVDRKYPADQIRMIDEILGLQKATREEYEAAIARGDEHFAKREWEEAEVDYVTANDLIPEEQYPDDKITEINNILAMLKAEMENYTLAIKNADRLFAEKDYRGALLEYRKAADIFSDEEYPRSKIEEINGLLAAAEQQQQLDDQYAAAIGQGDLLLQSEQYPEARAAYQKALTLKPAEQYPLEKIAEIEGIVAGLEKQRQLDQNYAAALASGNSLLAEGKYYEARSEFQRALSLKPQEPEPARRIEEVNILLAEQQREAEIDALYTARISEADAYFAEAKYENARQSYLEAAALKPAETYPGSKVTEIDGILTAMAAEAERQALLDANYSKAIADADALYAAEDLAAARKKYLEAKSMKPEETYPQQKISEIEGMMAAIDAQRALDENYAESITAADALLRQEKYAEARTEYARAAEMKPAEQYPRGKLAEIDGILAEIARLQGIRESYRLAFESAEGYFADRKYNEARMEYERAATIKPDEIAPAARIREIDAILAELQQKEALDASYGEAIALADRLFGESKYQESIAAYRNALELKPEETYPSQRITEAENALRELERLAALQSQYDEIIKTADGYYDQQEYNLAREAYASALKVKPGESYPADRITEIDAIMADQEQQRQLNEAYAGAIATADALFSGKDYAAARTEYENALNLKPGEQYPRDQIILIDAEIARMEQEKKLNEDYSALIAAADAFFAGGQYPEARQEYQKAGGLKPAETYPQNKITEIDSILAEQQRQADLDASYASSVTVADDLFNSKQYVEAIEAYRKAAEIKPDEVYPGQKISEAEAAMRELERLALMQQQYEAAIGSADNHFNAQRYAEAKAGYLQAQELKPEEEYPRSRIKDIDDILAELEQQRLINEEYASAISRGDNLFSNQQLNEARSEFEKALALKPAEAYPAEMISRIDSQLNEIARQEELKAAYADAIGRADAFLGSDKLDEAKAAYNEALQAKPGDNYAAAKLQDIDAIIAEKTATQRKYDRAIASGDSLLRIESYENARKSYLVAIATLPGNKDYPEQKIMEIDATLAEIARLEAIDRKYRDIIADADRKLERSAYLEALQAYEEAGEIKPEEAYPKDKITEINARLSEMAEERQAAYDAAIVQADNYFDLGNYRKAKSGYETAVGIKPDEQYARTRLDEANKLYAAQVEALRADYSKFIADGDNYFKDKIYDGAIENYRLASALLPEEEYPARMISRITQIINDNAITDVNRLAQVIPNNTERKFSFTPLPVNVRRENYILIKARNVSGNEFKMLVNFGQDNAKSGGVVLQVPADGEARDYIIRIGGLYKWFSDDNNWISVYPEGGDIEVALVRISKSD